MLWFDGDWACWWTMSDGITLDQEILKAGPSIIVNNLVAKREGFELDYVTQEQKHYFMKKSWGYKKNGHQWKTP